VASQTVNVGSLVAKPADPTRSGYLFGGWYRDAGLATAWNFATDTVAGDMSLYAKWTEASVTLAVSAAPTLNLIPGVTDHVSATVSAATNNLSGYTLAIQADCAYDAGTIAGGNCTTGDNRLKRVKTAPSDTDYFLNAAASTGALAANTWGYQFNTIAGDTAPPDAGSSNWSPVPTTAATLKTTAAANNGSSAAATGTADNYNVFYGANVSTTQPAGNYHGKVLYTVIANP